MTAPTRLDADTAEAFLAAIEEQAAQPPYAYTYPLPDGASLTVRQDAAMRDRRVRDKSAVIIPLWYEHSNGRVLSRTEALAALQGEAVTPVRAEGIFNDGRTPVSDEDKARWAGLEERLSQRRRERIARLTGGAK